MADAKIDDLALIERDGSAVVTLDRPAAGGEGGGKEPVGGGERRRPDENVDALKRQLAEERRARQAAETGVQQAEQRRAHAERQGASGNLQTLEVSIASITGEKNALKNEYRAALEAGEFDKVTDIQERMNDAQIRLNDVVRGRDALKQRIEAGGGERQTPQPQQRQPSGDPVEDFIATRRVSRHAADWLRDHPECITDARKSRDTARAHEDAIYDGLKPDTREYFEYIEDKLGFGDNARERDGGDRGRDNGRREEPRDRDRSERSGDRGYSAPPSRSSGNNGRGVSGNQVNLTQAEVEFARESGMSLEAYARNKRALQEEGKLK